MKWIKKGLIFNSDHCNEWAVSGAMIPTPIDLNEKTIRVFLTILDKEGIGRTGFVDLSKDNLFEIQNISQSPVFDIGKSGTFDESGCLTCSVVQNPEGNYHFYYAGFEIGTKIRYRLLAGLAVTNNKFELLHKYQVPVLERTSQELYFRGGPYVIYEDQKYKMWYVGGNEWIEINGKAMPKYIIKYLESIDGIKWGGEGKSCIEIEHEWEHGFGRPYVIKESNIYKMFYSIRIKGKGYRLGYAESTDGIKWIRKDNEIGIDVSENGWDSEMICFSAVIAIKNRVYMFYNGNQFGKIGFGYAELEI